MLQFSNNLFPFESSLFVALNGRQPFRLILASISYPELMGARPVFVHCTVCLSNLLSSDKADSFNADRLSLINPILVQRSAKMRSLQFAALPLAQIAVQVVARSSR